MPNLTKLKFSILGCGSWCVKFKTVKFAVKFARIKFNQKFKPQRAKMLGKTFSLRVGG